jgi:hypothetical protein
LRLATLATLKLQRASQLLSNRDSISRWTGGSPFFP